MQYNINIMGNDITKENRTKQILHIYPDYSFLCEMLHKKIGENEENHSLYMLLGKVHYLTNKFYDQSHFYHVKYVETADEYYYIKYNELLKTLDDQMSDIKNDILNN